LWSVYSRFIFLDSNSLIVGTFDIPTKPSASIVRTTLPSPGAAKKSAILAATSVQSPALDLSAASKSVASVNVPPSQTSQVATEGTSTLAKPELKPEVESPHVNEKQPSTVVFTFDVSNVLEQVPSVQDIVKAAADNDSLESGEYDGDEGETDETYEDITYSRPKASFSEDSQTGSSDSEEWYALIQARRPKSYDQPPPISNIPSTRDGSNRRRRNQDARHRGHGDRRTDGRGSKHGRVQSSSGYKDVRGRDGERYARHDSGEARHRHDFVPTNDFKQRDNRPRMHHVRGSYSEFVTSDRSETTSFDSYTSTGVDDKGRRYTRYHHGHHAQHHDKKHRRNVGKFEAIARQIPKKPTYL
jgi:hypothetical protein